MAYSDPYDVRPADAAPPPSAPRANWADDESPRSSRPPPGLAGPPPGAAAPLLPPPGLSASSMAAPSPRLEPSRGGGGGAGAGAGAGAARLLGNAMGSISRNGDPGAAMPPPAAAAAASVGAPAGGASASGSGRDEGVGDGTDRQLSAELARLAKLSLGPETAERRNDRLVLVQAAESSHLGSKVDTFEQLHLPPQLLQGIQNMKFAKPSTIQELALPCMLQDPPTNLMAQAQSGSGKTVAFCLGLLYRVDTSRQCTQAMVITPTRELANQCAHETLMPMAASMDPPLRVAMALGGAMVERGHRITEHVVVGTPGKIESWLKMRALDLSNIAVLVLDEADEMIAQDGHRDSTTRIMRAMARRPPQTLLFSATYPPEVEDFARKLMPGALHKIKLASDEELVLDEITQVWVDLRGRGDGGRVQFLAQVYEILEMGQSIVFCQTKVESDRVVDQLRSQGFSLSNLHGGLEANQRDRCMKDFRDGRNKVLITTNVLSRGVDVPAVSLVINYDMPFRTQRGGYAVPDFETYLHRIGRTGRFGRQGMAINFIAQDTDRSILKAIEQHFKPGVEGGLIPQVEADVEKIEAFLVERKEEHNRKLRAAVEASKAHTGAEAAAASSGGGGGAGPM